MPSRRPILVAAVVVLSALALPAGTATAQECSLDATAIEPLILVYNGNVDEVPGILVGQLSGQRLDVRVESPDDEHRFAVTTDDDGRITAFDETAAADPTVLVETTETTFCEVADASDPAAVALDAYEDGEIEISGVGLGNRVKMVVAKLVKKVADLFSGLF